MLALRDATNSCVKFRLGRQGFGLPLAEVREIAAAGRITPVPLAPPAIKGLANLRGRVITLIDVSNVFRRPLPPARFVEDRLVLILSSPWQHLGVYVHAPVEIGRTAAEDGQVDGQAHMTMAAGGAAGATAQDAADSPALSLTTVSGDFVHMISASDLVAFCEAKVLEGFRRKS